MAALLCRMSSRSLLYTRFRGHRPLDTRKLLTDDYCKYKAFMKMQATALYFYKDIDKIPFKTIAKKLEHSQSISGSELKDLLYLCETTSEVELLKECLIRYYQNVGDDEYIFGPLFLRLCYSLGLVDTALEMFKEKSFRKMMSNYTSFNLMVDILYKFGQYERAMEVLLEMKAQGYKLNKITYNLAFATCYQLNDMQAMNIFFKEAVMNQTEIPRLALYFAISLYLKQGDYAGAMNTYEKIVEKGTSIGHNLNLLLAAKLGQEDKILQIMQFASKRPMIDSLGTIKLSKDVIDVAEEKLKPTVSEKKFYELLDRLSWLGQISTLTLDQMLHAYEVYDQKTS